MQPWQDPELDRLRAEHRAFAEDVLSDAPFERDRSGDFSLERWRRAAEFGVLGICMPESYGGQGRPVTHAVAAYEGLGEGCHDSGFLYALGSQLFGIQMVLQLRGSADLKERYLRALITGDRVSAHAFTEESSGSDAYSMETRATPDGAGYRLTGRKSFLTNAPYADVALVFCKTGEGRSPFALSAFMVDLDSEGASHGREFEKVGLRTVHMGELDFENVFVPSTNVVGRVGGGLQVLTESTGYERGVLLATALGPMSRGLDASIERTKERRQFGKPIGAFQQVSSRIADMTMRRHIARTLIYDMASKLGDGQSIRPHLEDAAITKLTVSDLFLQFELDALQIHGVRGYLLDHFAQQDLRDSLSGSIWAGTSETLRNTIAKLRGVPVE